jgi:hypothetical protein
MDRDWNAFARSEFKEFVLRLVGDPHIGKLGNTSLSLYFVSPSRDDNPMVNRYTSSNTTALEAISQNISDVFWS